jgi:hypothetical protein
MANMIFEGKKNKSEKRRKKAIVIAPSPQRCHITSQKRKRMP